MLLLVITQIFCRVLFAFAFITIALGFIECRVNGSSMGYIVKLAKTRSVHAFLVHVKHSTFDSVLLVAVH